MRYTEARLTKLAEEMMDDIEQDTVDWRLNFDGTLNEPVMLPTKFPNHQLKLKHTIFYPNIWS